MGADVEPRDLKTGLELTVGKALRRERDRAEVSADELARVSNLSVGTIRCVEVGLRCLSVRSIEILAGALDIEPAVLMLPNDDIGPAGARTLLLAAGVDRCWEDLLQAYTELPEEDGGEAEVISTKTAAQAEALADKLVDAVGEAAALFVVEALAQRRNI